jgi:predicted phosphoribosyltransferase
VQGRDVVVVDDGIATGLTARAALQAIRSGRPRRLLLAAPVAAPASAYRLGDDADEVIVVSEPISFGAVGEWYDDFSSTTDAEVMELLAAAAARFHGIQASTSPPQGTTT